jgi:AraC-like DNA-binding protein
LTEVTPIIPGDSLQLGANIRIARRYVATFAAARAIRRKEPAKSLILADVRDFLKLHATEEVSLDQLAVLSGLTRFHLCRAFHEQFGVSPHQYQLQLRVDFGRKLLVSGTGALEAALEAGFSSQSHFARHFKRVVGITPGQYLAQFRDRRLPPALIDWLEGPD